MKKDPNKNKDEIIVTPEGNFKRSTLRWLSWLRRNNQEVEDVLHHAEREYFYRLAKEGTDKEELESTRNIFYTIKRFFMSLRK